VAYEKFGWAGTEAFDLEDSGEPDVVALSDSGPLKLPVMVLVHS